MPSAVSSRAGMACSNCRARRVRCDATIFGIPCTRCQQRGSTDCKLLESRRGKYVRQPLIRRISVAGATAANVSREDDERSANPQADGGLLSRQLTTEQDPGTTEPDPGIPEQEQEPGSAGQDPSSPDISWQDIFQSFLESREVSGVLDNAFITYLGDSFPLTLVLEDLRDGGHRRVFHPNPHNLRRNIDSPYPSAKSHETNDAATSYLRSNNAFVLPKTAQLDELLAVFVERVYPFYPVVNLLDLRRQYESRNVPLILLQSICFVSVSYAPLTLVCAAGWNSRHAAREDIYVKVKALFDTGFEKDKLVILQSIILLTFRAGKPNDTWNFYAWMSMAVTLGEMLGLHRSMATSNLNGKEQSLMKRIWWILVLRDTFCAILFGRPLRIRDSQSDSGLISAEDFQYDFSPDDASAQRAAALQAQYLSVTSRLALILREIILFRFNSNRGSLDEATNSQSWARAMEDWRSVLPSELDWQQSTGQEINLFALATGFLYENNMMLLHFRRSLSSTAPDVAQDNLSCPPNVAFHAAENVSNMANTVFMSDKLMVMPHEIFSSIFLAEAVLYSHLRQPAPISFEVARMRLSICQMAMHKARDFWDSADWVTTLYQGLVSRLDHSTQDGKVGAEASLIMPSAFGTPVGDLWQGQLDLFDTSMYMDWRLPP